MPRKSAKMVRKGHTVVRANGREVKVLQVDHVLTDRGDMVIIHLADGEVWHRTPGAKIDVTRVR